MRRLSLAIPDPRAPRRRGRNAAISGLTTLLTALSVFLLVPGQGHAQWPESPLLDSGQLGLLLFPSIEVWDERYGPDGTEPLGLSLDGLTLGPSVLPGTLDAQAAFVSLLQDSAFALDLGRSEARLNASIARVPLGAALGVTRWLTVGATVPFVKRTLELDFLVDPTTGNAGLSPGLTDQAVTAFLAGGQTALGSVMQAVDATCASLGDTDPACMDGRTFLQDASDLLAALETAYGMPVFVLRTSAAAETLQERVDALRDEMILRGDSATVASAFAGTLPFPEDRITSADLQSFLTDPALGIGGGALGNQTSLWDVGDIEVFAALRLLARSVGESSRSLPVTDSTAATQGPGVGYLLGVQGTYRLGTGTPADPARPLHLGSGDGLDDIEVEVFGHLDLGRRLRLRGRYAYVLQQAGERVERVRIFGVPWAPASTQATRSVDPGDIRRLFVAPELRLTPELSLGGRYERVDRGADVYDETVPAAERALLEAGTEWDVQRWGLGLSLWPSAGSRLMGQWPAALSVEYLRSFDGSAGAPASSQVRLRLRVFLQAW